MSRPAAFELSREPNPFCESCCEHKPCVEFYDGEYIHTFCADCLAFAVALLAQAC